MPSKEDKFNLLSNANKLKDHDTFKNVYLSRDLTYQQRQEMIARRAVARNRGGTQPNGAGILTPPNTMQFSQNHASTPMVPTFALPGQSPSGLASGGRGTGNFQ